MHHYSALLVPLRVSHHQLSWLQTPLDHLVPLDDLNLPDRPSRQDLLSLEDPQKPSPSHPSFVNVLKHYRKRIRTEC